MKKSSLVFSLVREQSNFMTVVIAILTFLSILAFGIALSVGASVVKWNRQWDKYATVQILNQDNTKSVKKIIDTYSTKTEFIKEVTKPEMEKLLQPWISSGAKINNYLPIMYEIKFKSADDLTNMKKEIETKARFMTHLAAMQPAISAGWKLVMLTTFILVIILVSIGVCISYISRNIAMLHKHELEILNQVGAPDAFIAKQMQRIVGKISFVAGYCGLIAATPILFMILGTARSARVGLMSTMTLTGGNWIALIILPVFITIFSVYITKRTTLRILSGH